MSLKVAVSLSETEIHARAIAAVARYRKCEAELIDVLQAAERCRVHLKRGHASLFKYVVDELGLSENVAENMITIARKARAIPELKARITNGAITLSNARRVSAVLTPENQAE